MSSHTFPTRFFGWMVLALGGLCLVIIAVAFTGYGSKMGNLEGRLLPDAMQGVIPWKVLSPESLINGTILPGNTNVILVLPSDTRLLPNPITKKVLFGTNSADVRYWGYCLPSDYDRERAIKTTQLPGKVFLSDGERKARDEEWTKKLHGSFSIEKNLTEEDLNQLRTPPKGLIHNQIETFDPESICYVMSQKDLAVGIDTDDDEANNEIEKVYQTNYLKADSDGDGMGDGCEIFRLHTNSLQRDSDGDGLIDGVEDANHNCRYDVGKETDPLEWDTDRDGIPDGLMKLGNAANTRLTGEDKNLNGIVDSGETNPKKWSTAGDGISDGDRYWKCIFNNEKKNPDDC